MGWAGSGWRSALATPSRASLWASRAGIWGPRGGSAQVLTFGSSQGDKDGSGSHCVGGRVGGVGVRGGCPSRSGLRLF